MSAQKTLHRHAPPSRSIFRNRAAASALAAAALASLAACSSPQRTILTDAQLAEHAAADTALSRQVFGNAIGRVLARIEREVETATPDSPAVVDILALSGGGDYGAFGAGLLVGWANAPDPAHRMPDFEIVTGVSTGALLAPFAYVGTDSSCRFVEDFYRDPKSDWVRERGLFFFLPSNPSFMTIPGLERDIRTVINKEFVEQMAEQSRNGKLLAISATDLDLGRQKFWDIGAEAEAAVQTGDLTRVQNIMLASAAIPAIFPPVEIDGGLYADGGVTANVFLRLDPRSPDAMLPRWYAENPGKPFPKVRYWVVINNQLAQTPKTAQAKWPAVMSPSLATAIRSATIAEVRWLTAQVDWVNAVLGTDIEVRVTSIPNDWRPPVKGDFKKETMASLAEIGRRMGADPNSWTIWASPETAKLDHFNGRILQPPTSLNPAGDRQ